MPKIEFLGRVVPEAFKISVNGPGVQISNPTNGLEATFWINIGHSELHIIGEANRYVASDFSLLVTRAQDLASAAVDLIGFSSGTGFRAILDTFIAPNGVKTAVIPGDPTLRQFCTAYALTKERQDDFDAVFRLVTTNHSLFLALNDLMSGLIFAHQSPIVCARAIENLRVAIAPKGMGPNASWQFLQTALAVSKTYLQPITDTSRGPRHGDHKHTPGISGRDLADRTWTVMNRSLEYFKRAQSPLPESEFPMLT